MGPVKVVFENRMCYVGALVLGDEVLLGAVPIDDMDLVLSPSQQKITANPAHPNIPHARVKWTLPTELAILGGPSGTWDQPAYYLGMGVLEWRGARGND